MSGLMCFVVRDLVPDRSDDDDLDLRGYVRVHDALDLFDQMDEWGNPNLFEYARIPNTASGGVFFSRDSGTEMAASWYERNLKWKRFDQLIGQPYDQWYAEVYIPSLPQPGRS